MRKIRMTYFSSVLDFIRHKYHSDWVRNRQPCAVHTLPDDFTISYLYPSTQLTVLGIEKI